MAAPRRVVEFEMSDVDRAALEGIARSRTEKAGRVSRARMLLGYRETPSFHAVGRQVGVAHQTVTRCVERARDEGVMAALSERPRPGKAPTITSEARAWLVSLACDKAKDHGYPHEIWTTRLLTSHAKEHCVAAGYDCLSRLSQGTVCKILAKQEIKPHKIRYYLERRDPDFAEKMVEVLCVYREVALLRETVGENGEDQMVAILSYDEKPGIQALGTVAPDLPPVPGKYKCLGRDYEYVRHGTLSLLAGIDLVTGRIYGRLEERHRSLEFIAFLEQIDAAYPRETALKLIMDNHSAHISKQTKAWLAEQREGRFEFVFTPKHGSWLNLIEGFFSKMTRSMLRHIRVASKQELKDRIMAYLEHLNLDPVVHKWSYKLDAQKAA